MGIRFFQATVAENADFRRAVLASAMRVAYIILTTEASTVPEYAIRKRAASTMFGDIGSTRERMISLFAWYAIFQPEVQAVVYDATTGKVTPQNLNDDFMDNLVSKFWTTASRILADVAP
jgi:hypothetical protein